MLSPQQLDFFEEKGYLIVRDLLSGAEAEDLQNWAQEVHDWVPNTASHFMPYKVDDTELNMVLLDLVLKCPCLGSELSWSTRTLQNGELCQQPQGL